MAKVGVIDSGNLGSVLKALTKIGAEPFIIEKLEDCLKADRLVFPGIGAFADCRAKLNGLTDALTEAVIHQGRPFLGICVGMQLMATAGYEGGPQAGLNWIPGEVVPIPARMKVPHMGWNEIIVSYPEHPVLEKLPIEPHGYFVHSYHFVPDDRLNLLATTEYGGMEIAAVVGRDNLLGTQFHPEKSQTAGLMFLKNFIEWQP